jgi:hypothetical protein
MEYNNSLKRDMGSKFIINKDEKAYTDYKFKVEIYQELKSLREEVDLLKIQLNTLKEKN